MLTANPNAGLRLSRTGFTSKTRGHFSNMNDLYQHLLNNDAVRAERLRLLLERFTRLEARVAKLAPAGTAPAPAPGTVPAPAPGTVPNLSQNTGLFALDIQDTGMVRLGSQPSQTMSFLLRRVEGYAGTMTFDVAALPEGVSAGPWVNQTFTATAPSAEDLELARERERQYSQIVGQPYDPAKVRVVDAAHIPSVTFTLEEGARPGVYDIYPMVKDTQGHVYAMKIPLYIA